jgi:hypothetical protein
MSYRVWWLLAFWALGVGVAIELERPDSNDKAEPQAAAHAAPASVAERAGADKRG